jgi:hypothetical protein
MEENRAMKQNDGLSREILGYAEDLAQKLAEVQTMLDRPRMGRPPKEAAERAASLEKFATKLNGKPVGASGKKKTGNQTPEERRRGSQSMKRYWAGLTPKQRALKIKKMKDAQRISRAQRKEGASRPTVKMEPQPVNGRAVA